MKRYNIKQRFTQHGKDRDYEKFEIIEDEKGEFVRYEDHKKQLDLALKYKLSSPRKYGLLDIVATKVTSK